MRSTLYTLLLFATVLRAAAQLTYPRAQAIFDGAPSFWTDSVLNAGIKEKGVRSVTQQVTRPTYTHNAGTYFFDRQGRLSEYAGSGRFRNEYSNGRLVKLTRFDTRDTTRISESTTYTYDSKGRLLLIEKSYEHDGKVVTEKDKESKIVYDSKDKTRTETTNYYRDKIIEMTYTLDSIAGDDIYRISYTYEPGKTDEKGRKRGKKTLHRIYMKNNCRYEHEVNYEVLGRLEVAEEIKTRYYQGDEKGRLIEYGEIDYMDAVMQYYSRHPEQFSYGYYSPKLIMALLNGELEGEREWKIKQVFDSKGRMVEKAHYGKKYRFTYNNKGQLTEQLQDNSREQIWYNEKGLIIRTRTTPVGDAENPDKFEESKFSYTYY